MQLFALLLQLFALLLQLFALLLQLFVFLLQFFFAFHYCRVTVFYRLVIFVLHVHVLTHFGVGGSGSKTMEHIHHVGIILIFVLVDVENLFVLRIFPRLVEYAEHFFKAVVHAPLQSRYLHYYTVVCKALHKRLLLSVLDHLSVVVVYIVVDVYHRLLDVAHTMSEQIDRHHGVGETFGRVAAYVQFVAVLRTKILAETQCLRVEPCLLQFY